MFDSYFKIIISCHQVSIAIPLEFNPYFDSSEHCKFS